MPGNVTQYPDFSVNTNSDTGENNAASVLPVNDGEALQATVLNRPVESLRQRTEVVRSIFEDSLYLRDADRRLVLAGPGLITWPGSTTAAQTGIPVLSDDLYLVPMAAPGANQTPPVPPVASNFGTLHLQRASDSMNSILVTSQRRSYAAGDQINVTVASGGSFSCTLDVENTYQRTIHIVATGATTLSQTITALNALIPSAPDNTQLVTAALEGGALGTDLLKTPQAKQFVSGNYDGEGHTLTPANVASFFSSNPTQALAEGDSLCVQFAMVSDTASTGGRRQAIPENSNTAVAAGAFFNSRVHPEKLVNCLPICKVVSGFLVFNTGVQVNAGAVLSGLNNVTADSVTYDGGSNWADGTTNPATTVDLQLDKIISDLAGSSAGASKIQGPTVGTYLTAGPLGGQITTMANFVHDDRAPTESSTVPLRTFRDYLGNVRSLVDHNGYRMGQVSEIDENWRGAPVTVHLDPTLGFKATGSAGPSPSNPYGVLLTTNSDLWVVPLSGAVPIGSLITNIVVWYTSANTANVLVATLDADVLSTNTSTAQVSRTISPTSMGFVSFDIMSTPTSGHGPKQYVATDKENLLFSCNITTPNIQVYDIQITYVQPPAGWTYSGNSTDGASNGDSFSYQDPIAGFNQRHVQLIGTGTSALTGLSQLTTSNEFFFDANCAFVMEGLLKTGTVIDGPNVAQVDWGVATSIGSFVGLFAVPGTLANWQLKIGFANTDTGVPVANSTVLRSRLEMLGSGVSSAGGGNARVRLYLNDVLVANVVEATFVTAPLGVKLAVNATGNTSGPYDVRVGRLRRTWNHLLSGDLL